jgi:hypothetical protein
MLSPLSMAFASTSSDNNDDFLDIREATIDAGSDEMSAFLETHGHIPTDGSGEAFGYGILTSEGLDAVVVSTTHRGVLDSETQTNVDDPVWHNHFVNHFVTLEENSDNCGDDLKVQAITFESPGQVDINDSNADLTQIPASFSGTDALSGDDLTLEPGTDVEEVVSFRLSPQFNDDDDDDELKAVCVTDVLPAENIVFNDNGNGDDNSNSNSNNGNSASQGIGQSQGSTQEAHCASGGDTTASCNNLSAQAQGNTGNNAAGQN